MAEWKKVSDIGGAVEYWQWNPNVDTILNFRYNAFRPFKSLEVSDGYGFSVIASELDEQEARRMAQDIVDDMTLSFIRESSYGTIIAPTMRILVAQLKEERGHLANLEWWQRRDKNIVKEYSTKLNGKGAKWAVKPKHVQNTLNILKDAQKRMVERRCQITRTLAHIVTIKAAMTALWPLDTVEKQNSIK